MPERTQASLTRLVLSIALALPVGCASDGPSGPAPMTGQQLLSREGTVADLRTLGGGEAGWTTRSDGRASEPVHDADEEMWWTEVPIGEDGVRCYVYEGERDLAALATILGDHHLRRAVPEGSETPERRLVNLDVDVVDGTGFMDVRWIFTTVQDDTTLVFDSKIAVANRHGHGLACESLDAGYFETFRSVFRHWVGSFDAEVEWPAYFRETMRVRVGDQPIGLATTTMQRDEDGDTKLVTMTSMLLPTGPGSLSQTDQQSVEWTHEDGTLIVAYEAEGGAHGLTTDLTLKRTEGIWGVTGTVADKEITAELGDIELTSSRSDYLALERQLAPMGDRTEMVMARWVASADPTQVFEVRHADVVVADDGTSTMVSQIGPLTMTSEREASGAMVRTSVAMGAQTMTMERLHVAGTL